MTSPTTAEALRVALTVNPAVLAQRVSGKLAGQHRAPAPAISARAAPIWPHEAVVTAADGTRFTVVPCVSVLAVWDQLARPHEMPCVLLTDLSHDELGVGILAQVFEHRLINLDRWTMVSELFGAQQHDLRLEAYRWVGRAIIEATPPEGWPRLAGPLLERDVALRHLAAQRLGLHRLGLGLDGLDTQALLCWTRLEAAPQAFADLPDEERQGLLSWLAHVAGPTARVVGALLDRGRADLALPLGLVCAALWADEQPDTVRRRGRVDQYLDAPGLDDDVLRAFGQHSVTTVRDILREVGGPDASAARELCRTILDEADDLLVSFGATTAASRSGILRSGFAHRRDVAAEAMRTAISSVRRGGATTALAEAAAAVADLAEHDLARHDLGESHRRTAHRAQMAMRLLRWLDSPLRVQEPPVQPCRSPCE